MASINDIKPLVDEWARRLGDALVSVIVHGPVLQQRQIETADVVPLIVVAADLSVARLRGLGEAVQHVRLPFKIDMVFFTPGELADSLDVFPLELMEARSAYSVMHGADVLEALNVDKADLRLQIEEDLKTKRTWLRQRYVDMVHQPNRLATLPVRSFEVLIPLLRAMLRWRDQRVPPTPGGLLDAVADTFGVDRTLLSDLQHGVETNRPLSGSVDVSIEHYAELLNRLIQHVDHDPHT